jgi:hypothetical protein
MGRSAVMTEKNLKIFPARVLPLHFFIQFYIFHSPPLLNLYTSPNQMSSEEYLGEEDEYVYDDSLSRSSTSSTIPVNLSRTSTSTSTQAGTNTNLALSTAQSNLTGIRLIFRTFGNASSSAAVSTGEDTYSYDVFST